MRQLTYVKPGVLEWWDVPEPRIEADTDAIVRPLAVTRCDLDLLIATGAARWPGAFAMGHETVGYVVDVGPKATSVKPGELVVVPFQISCGECSRCRRGHTALCETVAYRSSYGMKPLSGVEWGGGLSDMIRVPFADHMLVPAPLGASPEGLAGAADNVTDGYRLVAPILRERPGAPVLVVGGPAAGIGLYAVQSAIALGAERVVYVDSDATRVKLAHDMGAEGCVFDLTLPTPPIGEFPHVVDASGSEDGLAFAVRHCEPEGTVQRSYGDFKDRTAVPLKEMYGRHIGLKACRCHARHEMPAVLDLIGSGRLKPEVAITRFAAFEDAAEAMLDPTIKVVFSRGR